MSGEPTYNERGRHAAKVADLALLGYRTDRFRQRLATAFVVAHAKWGGHSHDDTLIDMTEPFVNCVSLDGPISQKTMRNMRSLITSEAWFPIPDAIRFFYGSGFWNPTMNDDILRVEVVEVVNQHKLSSLRLCQWSEVYWALTDWSVDLVLNVIDISASSTNVDTRRLYGFTDFQYLEFDSDYEDFVASGLRFDAWVTSRRKHFRETYEAA